ncbi:MAG: amidohydrolase family protein [Actinobacteria bacterium]|nr:amidohydrolase family protein [Actinomycetota bacterium]
MSGTSAGRLLVRGGTVLDGTGGPPVAADVLAVDGRIAEVGPGLDATGARVLDAGGAFVTPGFIDTHTHLDPQLFWDRGCDPMPQHGVTTVLIGNCSLGLAPVRPEAIDELSTLFCYIEDMPREAFALGIPWTWERYPDYRDALADGGLAVHAAVLLGHSALRLYVMGDDAWDRAATDDERARIAALLDESVAAGAYGFSTSFFDADARSRPVPSRLADVAEHDALLAVLEARGRGFVEFIPQTLSPEGLAQMDDFVVRCARHGVTVTTNVLVHNESRPDYGDDLLARCRDLRARGADFWPQMSPRTIDFRINWETSMVFMNLSEWHRVPNAPDDATRAALLRDPDWRAAARLQWDGSDRGMFPTRHPTRVRFIEVTDPALESWLGRTLADLVAERGGHPSDVLADWVLANDLRPGVLVTGVANSDVDEVARFLVQPDTLVASSDAGAHVQMMCAAGDTTLYLTRHVRDRGDVTVEQAVHELSAKQADVFGFRDRGRVVPGLAADLTVFALDELHWDDDVFVTDLPGGSRRLRRPPGGYRYTVANGEVTQEAGVLTGATPAGVLDSAVG